MVFLERCSAVLEALQHTIIYPLNPDRLILLINFDHHESNHLPPHSLATFSSVIATPSAGCGKAPTTLKNGMNTLTIDGATRPFIVHLPENYHNTKLYRTIFVFHATSGKRK